MLLQAKTKANKRNGSNKEPKLCYHAKLHGKLPFTLASSGLSQSNECQGSSLYTVKLGEASLSSFGVFREGVFQKMPALEGQFLKEIPVRFAGKITSEHRKTQNKALRRGS